MGDAKADMESKSGSNKGKLGGFRACSFAFALMALENMGFIANMASLVLYFIFVMHFDVSSSSNTLTNLMGSAFLLSIVGAFISDAYLNRYYTILIFGVLEILALMLMTIQAHSKSLHPSCGRPGCVEGPIAVMLYFSLYLLALGSGGVRGALPSLGADQFDEKDPKEAKALASYFNWSTLVVVIGGTLGVTVVVWVSIYRGWYKGFLISTVATFVGLVVLAFGKPFYRLRQPGQSPLLRIWRVIVLAVKNRRLPLSENVDQLYEISDKEAVFAREKIAHTNQFRFLDKAAIITISTHDDKDELKREEAAGKVCSVTQVEEVKILTRMMPILLSTIIMNTCLAQLQTFSVQQGSKMNLYLGNFQVPAPSVPTIPLVFMIILIPIYEFLFVPLARKITGHPSGITQLQRVGIGLVLSVISMAIAGVIEVKRRNRLRTDPHHPISLFWLSFQYGIFGIADMFTLVGLLEFFYREAPAGMKSLSTSFTWLSLSLGYFLSTVLVNIINGITGKITPSKKGWLEGETVNETNLHLFYWFLAILSCLNFANYLYWASWYKYKPPDNTEYNRDPPSTNNSILELDGMLPAKEENNGGNDNNTTTTTTANNNWEMSMMTGTAAAGESTDHVGNHIKTVG